MARVPNIKIGGGNVKIGHGLVQNSMKQWNGTGDWLTYTDLIDRPDYYLKKVSNHFGLSYNKNYIKKNRMWNSTNPKLVKNPGLGTPPVDPRELPDLPTYTITVDHDHFKKYTEPHYRLSFDHPTLGVLESRKLKHYFTCEEIQTAINEDLIFGYSGYSVSNVGDINFPSFGPYMLQSNWTGVNDNPLYVSEQSNSDWISGFVTGYPGTANSHSHYTLNFFKTGSGIVDLRFQASNFDPGTEVNAIIHYEDYDLNAGSYVGGLNNVDVIENSGVNSRTDAIDVILSTEENGGIISKPLTAKFVGRTSGIEFLFSDMVDPDDSDKKFYITGARNTVQMNVLRSLYITKPQQFDLSLEVDGDGANGYTKENYWYLGAPSGYLAHRYFNYTGIKITNSSEIRGFRIPPAHVDTVEKSLKRIECINNPNLEHFRGHPYTFRNVAHIDFSGCAIATPNDLHRWHDSSFYSSTGEYPHNVYRAVPDYLRNPYYNGIEVDEIHDQAVPQLVDFSPVVSSFLTHINLAENNLNQTGIYYWIRSALIGYQQNGYLNISNQSARAGPESAVFDGLRADQYPGEIKDINNLCISGIEALRDKSWTVIHDGSFDRL